MLLPSIHLTSAPPYEFICFAAAQYENVSHPVAAVVVAAAAAAVCSVTTSDNNNNNTHPITTLPLSLSLSLSASFCVCVNAVQMGDREETATRKDDFKWAKWQMCY